jgi:hypothetical protein
VQDSSVPMCCCSEYKISSCSKAQSALQVAKGRFDGATVHAEVAQIRQQACVLPAQVAAQSRACIVGPSRAKVGSCQRQGMLECCK